MPGVPRARISKRLINFGYNLFMRYVILIFITSLFCMGAKLPEYYGAEEGLKIAGFYVEDSNGSCVVLYIKGSAIGTQNDQNGMDRIDFSIYDDGELKATRYLYVKKGKKENFSALFTYEAKEGDKTPGVAIESKDLNIYIDPYYLKYIHASCDGISRLEEIEELVGNICEAISRFGGSCR